MRLPSAVLIAMILAAVAACDPGSGSDSPPQGPAAGGGKSDDLAECELGQAVVDGALEVQCEGPAACCAAATDAHAAASGCPMSATLDGAACLSTVGRHAAPDACCAALCGGDERFVVDDAAGGGQTCVGSAGQPTSQMCCWLNNDLECEGAQFADVEAVDGQRHCTARTGRDALAPGFARAACCAESCFDAYAAGPYPRECTSDLDFECSSPFENFGRCFDSDLGRFVKGACCGMSGEARARADEAYLCQEIAFAAKRCDQGVAGDCEVFAAARSTGFTDRCCDAVEILCL